MAQSDQQDLLNALVKQQTAIKKVNRILYILLPIVAFMVCVICANATIASTIGTFIMLTIALLAVGIKRWSIFAWLFLVAVYCLADNLFTYGTIATRPLEMQMGVMLFFVVIIHMARPYLDRMMIEKI